MRKQKDFDTALLVGMVQALDIAKKKGLDALEEDIRARKRTKINPPMYFYDLDSCTDNIRNWSMKRVTILFIGALHDVFGFGPGRIAKVLNKVADASRLIQTGEATWWDYSQEIDDQLGLQIIGTENGIRIEVRKR